MRPGVFVIHYPLSIIHSSLTPLLTYFFNLLLAMESKLCDVFELAFDDSDH